MIKRIFFDLDNTLIYSSFHDPDQEHLLITLGEENEEYFTIVRPAAHTVLEYARNLVGEENVFILTSSVKDYATQICDKAGFGFKHSHIFSREDLNNSRVDGAYGMSHYAPNENIADKNNVLIDDLHLRYNEGKQIYIGISYSRYLQVRPYYGVLHPEDEVRFINNVTKFLQQHAISSVGRADSL